MSAERAKALACAKNNNQLFLEELITFSSIRWEIIQMVGSPPSISDRNSPWVQAYLKDAETVWGVSPAFKREDGSVTMLTDFQQKLGVDVVNMGFGLPTDNMHGPNEKLELPNWYRGIDALIHFFFNLADQNDR